MPIQLTERAAEELRKVVEAQEDAEKLMYLRLGLKGHGTTRGYTLDLEDSIGPDQVVFESQGFKVTCTNDDLPVLDETTVDYRQTGAAAGFVFNVPEKEEVTRNADASRFPKPTEDQVRQALYKVNDPEVGVNIVDLGLLFEMKIEDRNVNIRMTLTTPACPLEGQIKADINRQIRTISPGVDAISVAIVWTPRWSPDLMTPEGKRQLGWS